MEGIRRALVIGLVLIAGTAIEQDPSVGPRNDQVVWYTDGRLEDGGLYASGCLPWSLSRASCSVVWNTVERVSLVKYPLFM